MHRVGADSASGFPCTNESDSQLSPSDPEETSVCWSQNSGVVRMRGITAVAVNKMMFRHAENVFN